MIMHETPIFPLFLALRGRRVIVVGGGEVGAHKARELIDVGARVTIVDPHPGEEARALVGATIVPRDFRPSDLDDAWLVVAATNDRATNAAVSNAADARRMLCNAVDDPEHCSAYFASVVRRPPLTVAISSTGEAPALTRLLREIFEQILPSDDWIDRARALRRRWRAERTPMRSRFGELVRAFAERAG